MVGPMSPATAAPLRMPPRVRLADQVVALLLDAVLDGRIPPGSMLPPERELAADLDVNRTSLRQAIARLEQMRVVEARQGRGTVVLDPRESSDAGIMAHLVAKDRRAMLAELFEVRAALAGLVGWGSASRGSAKEKVALRAAFESLAGAATAPDRQQLELALFRELVGMTRNRPLISMQHWVDRSYGEAADQFTDAFADADAVIEGLAPLIEAVEAGDAELAAATAETYASTSGERMLAAASRPTGRQSRGATR